MNRNKIIKSLLILISLFFSLTLLILYIIFFIKHYSNIYTKELQKCQKSFLKIKYIPKTGDLVLLQYKNAGLYKYNDIKHIPSHCGIVIIKHDEAYVLEATKFDTLKNYFNSKLEQKSGVRLVKLSDLINSVDNYFAIRPIKNNLQINEKNLLWAKNLTFYDQISNEMNITTLLAVGIGPYINSKLSKQLYRLAGLLKTNRTGVFCSEFISMFLQREGHIKKEFSEHWSLSPINFTSNLKSIDLLCPQLNWGKEIKFICS